MSAVINGEVIDQLVQTAEYEVTVTAEHFKLSATTVTTLSTGEQLPCSPTSKGCVGACHAYSCTIAAMMDCPLQVIPSTVATCREGSMVLVDELAQW